VSDILDFYRGEYAWDKTKVNPHPSGYSHFDIIHNWSDDKWEVAHDFIQWLFPLKEPSNFNPDAPLLTDEDVSVFQADESLKEAMVFSVHRFLRFLGLHRMSLNGGVGFVPNLFPEDNSLSISKEPWQIKLMEPNAFGLGEEFFTKEEIAKKHRVWENPNHNWFRITRCLASLRLLGLQNVSDALFKTLCELYDSNRGITSNTLKYWQDAAQGGLE
jgi:hypothetical protein